jgi:hypothetical protein
MATRAATAKKKFTARVKAEPQATPLTPAMHDDAVVISDELDQPESLTSEGLPPPESLTSQQLPLPPSEVAENYSMKLMLGQLTKVLEVLQSSATKQNGIDFKLTLLDTKLQDFKWRLTIAEAKLADLDSKTARSEIESKHLKEDMTDTRMNALELKLQTSLPARPTAAVSTYSMLELARLLRSKKYNKEVFPSQDEGLTKRRRKRRKNSKKLIASIFGGDVTKKLAGRIRRRKNA